MTGSPAHRFVPAGPLRGHLRVPSDKSITHRALMLGAIGETHTRVDRPLWAGDTRATADVLRALGIRIDAAADGQVAVVHGAGLRGLRPPAGVLDARNSGTTIRLLAGLLAGQQGEFTLDGDESLRRRPMDRIVEPLRAMGVAVKARDGRFAPLTVGGATVCPVTYELPVASAQVKSCVLFAGLYAHGRTTVVEKVPSRDHTERLLRQAGVSVRSCDRQISVSGPALVGLSQVAVPGDLSSAAFLAAAATLVPGSELRIEGVGLNPTRLGFFEVLRRMGGSVEWQVEGGEESTDDGPAGEPWGTMVVRHAELHGTRVTPADIPLLIDEVPLVALLATAAEGETVVEGAGELRVKESDRLAAVAQVLGGLGAQVESQADGFRVRPSRLAGGRIDSGGDHRVALLGAVAGLICEEGVSVLGFAAADVSSPGFEQALMEVTGG
jgi:3-phosphoshikimate 1-carboxyvinyltransferase